MARRNLVVLAGFGLALVLPVAVHGQYNPPPWWNHDDGRTTSYCWQFSDPSNPLKPDLEMNPFGTWQGSVGGATSWHNSIAGHDGVVGVGPQETGDLGFWIPNRRIPKNIKHCWLQVDFYETNGSDVSLLLDSEAGSNIMGYNEVDEALGNGWYRATVTWQIKPQPNWESFTFTFAGSNANGAYIDNLYFGTQCVPEPASILVASLGLAAMALRRRRSA
jgi:hypothetical protein